VQDPSVQGSRPVTRKIDPAPAPDEPGEFAQIEHIRQVGHLPPAQATMAARSR